MNQSPAGSLYFDGFELDALNGELRRDGAAVALQPQPFKLLSLLAERGGQIVSREEIRVQLWGTHTFVDFDRGLNFCIRQIRKALGDQAWEPRYIETRRGRGYRFLPHVSLAQDLKEIESAEVVFHPALPRRRNRPLALAILDGALDEESNRACLKGRYHLNQRTEKGLYKAIEYFNRAISVAPDNAAAYAGLAGAYAILSYYGSLTPETVHGRAKAAARKALQLDPGLADAHAALAYCSMLYEWNWTTAESGLRRAIELDPYSVTAHQWYADFLTAVKRHDEAIAQILLALELDPLSIQINTDVAWVLLHADHHDQAIAQYRHVLEMDEKFGLAHWGLGLAYGQSGMFLKAIDSLEEAIRITERTPAMLAALGHVYATSGRKTEAQKVLSELVELASRRYVPAYDMATLTWALRDFGQTIGWLKKACRERSAYLVNLKVDSRFAELRSLQPMEGVMRQIGLAA